MTRLLDSWCSPKRSWKRCKRKKGNEGLRVRLVEGDSRGCAYRNQRKQTHRQLDDMEMRVKWLKAEAEEEKRKRTEAERIAEEMLLQLALDENESSDTSVVENVKTLRAIDVAPAEAEGKSRDEADASDGKY